MDGIEELSKRVQLLEDVATGRRSSRELITSVDDRREQPIIADDDFSPPIGGAVKDEGGVVPESPTASQVMALRGAKARVFNALIDEGMSHEFADRVASTVTG